MMPARPSSILRYWVAAEIRLVAKPPLTPCTPLPVAARPVSTSRSALLNFEVNEPWVIETLLLIPVTWSVAVLKLPAISFCLLASTCKNDGRTPRTLLIGEDPSFTFNFLLAMALGCYGFGRLEADWWC